MGSRRVMETREEVLRRSVNETLDSIVSDAVRDSLLADALAAAALPAIPAEPGRYQEFLDRALRPVLERALGRELGRSVAEELERLTGLLDSGVAGAAMPRDRRAQANRSNASSPESSSSPDRRPTRADLPQSRRFTLPAGARPSGAPESGKLPASERVSRATTVPAQPAIRFTEPRPPSSGDFPSGTADALGMPVDSSPTPSSRRLPMVFVASREPDLVRRFAAWLDPRAVVVRVSRLMDLLLDLEDVGARRTVIVFDHLRPPFRPEALAALAEELPEESRVLLWGATRELQIELAAISTRVTRWTVCAEATPLADVVERCVKLVG